MKQLKHYHEHLERCLCFPPLLAFIRPTGLTTMLMGRTLFTRRPSLAWLYKTLLKITKLFKWRLESPTRINVCSVVSKERAWLLRNNAVGLLLALSSRCMHPAIFQIQDRTSRFRIELGAWTSHLKVLESFQTLVGEMPAEKSDFFRYFIINHTEE